MGNFRYDPINPQCVHPDDVLRVDRQILCVGPVALYGNAEWLGHHVNALKSYGYQCTEFTCVEWDSDEAMHRAFASQLNFPNYYGHNLNALNDCLCYLEIPEVGGVALILWNFDRFANLQPETAWHILDAIAQASWIHQLYGRRLLGLVHTDDPDITFAPVGARSVMSVNWECHK